MAIELQWTDSNNNIQHICFRGAWTLNEYYEAMKHSREMASAIDHTYVAIYDFTNTTGIPPNFLSTGRYAEANLHKASINVIVGTGRFLQMMMDMFNRLYPAALPNMQVCQTLGEAYGVAREAIKLAESNH